MQAHQTNLGVILDLRLEAAYRDGGNVDSAHANFILLNMLIYTTGKFDEVYNRSPM